MANHTERMVTLLGAFRRERNGLVADTMHYDGRRYGLNYGVSLPTVRRIVRAEERDHEFARFLYGQQVRELQLAALHLADPNRLADTEEAAFWLSGLQNSELAEEAAFALVSRSKALPTWMEACGEELDPLHLYLLLMAAARAPQPDCSWLSSSLQAVRQAADSPLIALLSRSLVALWAHLAEAGEVERKKTAEALSTLGHQSWEEYLREELSWRLEF